MDAWVGQPRRIQAITPPEAPPEARSEAAGASPSAPLPGNAVAGFVGQAVYGRRFAHVWVRVPGAAGLADLKLQQATAEAYRLIRRALASGDPKNPFYPVRFWNFIPGIVDAAGQGLDRYMVFNAGRYAAFADWFGGEDPDTFARQIATATGVGHAGTDLVIHALADTLPGRPLENPRQRSAYRYSPTYGPLPPCFARATLIAATETPSPKPRNFQGPRFHLLMAGTASIRGEASVHVGNVAAQTDETFANIEALLREAGAQGLAAMRSLRVYHTRAADARAIFADVSARLPQLEGQVEMVHAALCRPDLDIEIEGGATVR